MKENYRLHLTKEETKLVKETIKFNKEDIIDILADIIMIILLIFLGITDKNVRYWCIALYIIAEIFRTLDNIKKDKISGFTIHTLIKRLEDEEKETEE